MAPDLLFSSFHRLALLEYAIATVSELSLGECLFLRHNARISRFKCLALHIITERVCDIYRSLDSMIYPPLANFRIVKILRRRIDWLAWIGDR